MQIDSPKKEDLPVLAKIFQKELSLSFFNKLGDQFLHLYFYQSLKEKDRSLLALYEDNRAIGFAVYSKNPFLIFQRLILGNSVTSAKIFLKLAFRKPSFLFSLIKALLIDIKSGKDKTKAELISIAIEKEHQGKGFGVLLLQKIQDDFLKQGIKEFKVGVWDQMKESNIFYQKTKGKYYYSVNLFGRRMNYYLYTLISPS